MVDLESLSTRPDAVLLTFGAVRFRPTDNDVGKDPFEMEHFYRRIDPESCTKLGLQIDEPTMEWWAKQDDEVKEEAFAPEDRCNIADVLKEMTSGDYNNLVKVFDKHFGDMVILEYSGFREIK